MSGEYLLDTPEVRAFIAEVQAAVQPVEDVRERLEALRPAFSRLLQDDDWLPPEFRQPDEASAMGGGIASWLLYRADDGNLSFFALVVPPGASTPVHDHLAWGLVGLYAGEQDEEVYEPVGEVHDASGQAELRLAATNRLRQGSFYELIPPMGDIHRVTTTSAEPSISLHLLANDTGCVWRHKFEPEKQAVAPFRSGYTNKACETEAEA